MPIEIVKQEKSGDNLKTDMKNLLIVISLILLAGMAGAQEWQLIETYLEDDILGLSFLTPDSGIIVTGRGNYLKTVDAGKTWRMFETGSGVPLEDVCYLNSNSAYICGGKGQIYRTTDGFRTWQNVSVGDTMAWLVDIEMLDEKIGLVIGMAGDPNNPYGAYALRTTDGGATWRQMKSMGLGYSKLDYRPGGPLYMLAFGKLNYSDDLGKSWKSNLTVEGEACVGISIFENSGLLVGSGGMCAHTRDAGKTWRLTKRGPAENYVAAKMISETEGYIGGQLGLIMRTTDGGKTWLKEAVPRAFNIAAFDLAGDRLYAAGADGGLIYRIVK